MTSTLRVVLADDHPIVRAGLRATFQPHTGLLVVADVTDGLAAIRAVEALRPDVFLTDVALPRLGGIAATEHLKRLHPELYVIALTAHETDAYVRLMLNAGADGYVLKQSTPETLVRAIKAVAAGGRYLDPALGSETLMSSQAPRGSADLSARETEVVRLVAMGLSMKELASRLGLSPRTPETYKARAMEKLGLRSRADLVVYATSRGWLEEAYDDSRGLLPQASFSA